MFLFFLWRGKPRDTWELLLALCSQITSEGYQGLNRVPKIESSSVTWKASILPATLSLQLYFLSLLLLMILLFKHHGYKVVFFFNWTKERRMRFKKLHFRPQSLHPASSIDSLCSWDINHAVLVTGHTVVTGYTGHTAERCQSKKEKADQATFLLKPCFLHPLLKIAPSPIALNYCLQWHNLTKTIGLPVFGLISPGLFLKWVQEPSHCLLILVEDLVVENKTHKRHSNSNCAWKSLTMQHLHFLFNTVNP